MAQTHAVYISPASWDSSTSSVSTGAKDGTSESGGAMYLSLGCPRKLVKR